MKRLKIPQKGSRKKYSINLTQLNFNKADYALAGVVVALTVFGVVIVYNTSVVVAYEQFGDQYRFLKNQATWATVGVLLGFIASLFKPQVWEKYAPSLFIFTLILLTLVFIPGLSEEVYGARQRLIIPLVNVNIQPTELAKITLVFYLAYLFVSSSRKKLPFPIRQFFVVTGITLGLTALEPDLGGAVLIGMTALTVLYVAGIELHKIIFLLLGGASAGGLFAVISSYRFDRITDFIKVFTDPSGVSYHINQIFIALGSGGLLGLGLGNSRQKYQYIPEVTTDSIFAIIGEEIGFVGVLLLLLAILFIIWRGVIIAAGAKDEFSRLMAIGITANIGFQALVNIGGMVGIMPLTGVPLPFISYGGSSLTITLVSVGILLSVSRASKKIKSAL